MDTIEQANDLGRKAFHAGTKCAPALDKAVLGLIKNEAFLTIPILNAWLAGWHAENLAAPVPNV